MWRAGMVESLSIALTQSDPTLATGQPPAAAYAPTALNLTFPTTTVGAAAQFNTVYRPPAPSCRL